MFHQTALVALRFTAALFCMLAAVGCNNSPGSLVLQVTSVETPTNASEPIRVRATLEAVKGPVCLHQSAFMVWEVTPPGPDAKPIRSDRKMACCGTGVVECILLSPIIYPACLLDVADSQERYTVMQTGDRREFDIPIHVGDLDARMETAAVAQAEAENSSQEATAAAWTPGEYKVVLNLRNEVQHGGGSILPPPLFWIPYNQAVDVSVKVRIDPATQQAEQPEVE